MRKISKVSDLIGMELEVNVTKAILGTAKKLANCNIYGIEKGNVVINAE